MNKEDTKQSAFSDIFEILEIISSKTPNPIIRSVPAKTINQNKTPIIHSFKIKSIVLKKFLSLSPYLSQDPLDTIYDTYWEHIFAR